MHIYIHTYCTCIHTCIHTYLHTGEEVIGASVCVHSGPPRLLLLVCFVFFFLPIKRSSFFMLPYVSSILCVADHCAIYILIAGSYTPFMLISMHGNSLGRVVIIAEWLCALFGCVYSITKWVLPVFVSCHLMSFHIISYNIVWYLSYYCALCFFLRFFSVFFMLGGFLVVARFRPGGFPLTFFNVSCTAFPGVFDTTLDGCDPRVLSISIVCCNGWFMCTTMWYDAKTMYCYTCTLLPTVLSILVLLLGSPAAVFALSIVLYNFFFYIRDYLQTPVCLGFLVRVHGRRCGPPLYTIDIDVDIVDGINMMVHQIPYDNAERHNAMQYNFLW